VSLIDQLRDTSSNDLLDSSSNELLDSTRRSSTSAFIVSSTLTTSSQAAFLEGSGPEVDSTPAFLHGVETGSDSLPVFLAGGVEANSSCSVFLDGASGVLDSQIAFLEGVPFSAKSSQEAFTEAPTTRVYVREVWATVELTKSWPWTKTRAFTEGTHRSQPLPAYMSVNGKASTSARAWTASAFKRTRVHAFVDVIGYSEGSTPAFLQGIERSNVPAWTRGLSSNTWTLPVYLEGVERTSIHAYIVEGWPHIPVFLSGVDYWIGSIPAYLECAGYVVESIPAYMLGGTDDTDSVPAFCSGTGDVTGSISVFTAGVTRSNAPAYLVGISYQVDYIVLENSDRSISGRYRVMAEEYGDGVMQSGAQINKTIGGGVDVHTGKMFEVWSPVIKVRHTEEESGYGTVDDLKTLYEYVSLDTPPTRVITFYDHNQVRREVIFLEDFSKVVRLLQVEGTTAWYYVRLIMLKVPE